MNNIRKHLLLLSMLTIPILVISQQDCKVLKKEIAGTYEGGCKKGLAHGKGKSVGTDVYDGQFRKGLPHGKGKYTTADGAVYIGEWKKGFRDGEGEYTYKIEDRDTTVVGIWKADIYLGPKPKKPTVIRVEGLDRYSIHREGEGNRIRIDIYMNGTPNTRLESFSIISSTGNEFTMGSSFGYENIIYPVLVKISYVTWNKSYSSQHYVSFEFEIEEEANWKVVLTN